MLAIIDKIILRKQIYEFFHNPKVLMGTISSMVYCHSKYNKVLTSNFICLG